jgi:hypothetical protein
LSSTFIGTTTAPARWAPKKAIGKWGTFGSMTPTRSPTSTPLERNNAAMRAVASSSAAYETSTSSSLTATLSGRCATLDVRMSTKLIRDSSRVLARPPR